MVYFWLGAKGTLWCWDRSCMQGCPSTHWIVSVTLKILLRAKLCVYEGRALQRWLSPSLHLFVSSQLCLSQKPFRRVKFLYWKESPSHVHQNTESGTQNFLYYREFSFGTLNSEKVGMGHGQLVCIRAVPVAPPACCHLCRPKTAQSVFLDSSSRRENCSKCHDGFMFPGTVSLTNFWTFSCVHSWVPIWLVTATFLFNLGEIGASVSPELPLANALGILPQLCSASYGLNIQTIFISPELQTCVLFPLLVSEKSQPHSLPLSVQCLLVLQLLLLSPFPY